MLLLLLSTLVISEVSCATLLFNVSYRFVLNDSLTCLCFMLLSVMFCYVYLLFAVCMIEMLIYILCLHNEYSAQCLPSCLFEEPDIWIPTATPTSVDDMIINYFLVPLLDISTVSRM